MKKYTTYDRLSKVSYQTMVIEKIKQELASLGNANKAQTLSRYFKTGKGEYAEGDIFLGVSVPEQRKIAKAYVDMPLEETIELLQSTVHEHRLTALFILVAQYEQGGEDEKERIFNAYLAHTDHINNWDLVDLSAPKILGDYLLNKPHEREVLYHLARSKKLWERRIAMLATYTFIKHKMFDDAEKIATILVDDTNDLIHKAVGWMLREMGKKDQKREEKFLTKHHTNMPRTMLRYAIEKFDQTKKQFYMKK